MIKFLLPLKKISYLIYNTDSTDVCLFDSAQVQKYLKIILN